MIPRSNEDLADLAAIARRMLADHGLDGWSFDWDAAKKRRGACHWGEKRITFSGLHARYAPFAAFEETMLHEISHALAPADAAHGVEWQLINLCIGGDGGCRYGDDSYLPDSVRGRWRGQCPSGHTVWRYQRPKPGIYSCGRCGSRWDPRNWISWVDTLTENGPEKRRGQ